MMRLLFEDLAKKHFSPARVQKLMNWVGTASAARETGHFGNKANQYDKAEELITFYAFAPLLLRQDKLKIINEILGLSNVNEPAIGELSLTIEKPLPSPKDYSSWLRNEALKINPVRYVREQAIDHQERKKTLETATHVDAVIETGNFVIIVEMKFTSDISVQTTFNPYRNQLARLIDVGISTAIKKGKKLVLLVCSPSVFFVNKSRFYSYKITEYSNYEEIQRDIGWREQQEIEKYVLAVAWVPLESLVKVMYQDFNHPEVDEALEFFKERKLA